ncbi:NAD(P)/FAD-dependent oxidoreductase [Paenibacillus eucommiae]|uniref:Glycine/D-amino acid oxidase-like deaminating enzyme n=1 Tax=Paenibacillus eucommiae TaxID=1355755 RepID=A0ABS4J2C7_9BACL|nr:FAD-dependent oxidoreductase [Paenibacillus eucommiae]MBP1993996.1 glycine/D-amino acid oxidase-like deaminating enzyme [Paenibacillus eucommiae]
MMNVTQSKLHNGSLYWPSTMSDIPSYPALNQRVVTQVAIIGGGMTGAICAAVLARSGIPAVVVEGNLAASGSTAANTGLLQFSNDIMLHQLAEQIGEMAAVQFYSACRQALKSLSELADTASFETGFHQRSSLYCASSLEDASKLYKEYGLLRKYGFPVDWGVPSHIQHQDSFRETAALVTHGDAEVNPVRFAHGLIDGAVKQGTKVFEKTKVQEIERRNGRFVIHTANGQIIANQLVRAAGYLPGIESSQQIKPILRRSYAITTPPNSLPSSWPNHYMMWETARPYFYFRTTPDGRIIAGGLDENRPDPVTDSNYLENRAKHLLAELSSLFPEKQWAAEHAWCGTFGESADDLPFLGESPEQPGLFHALGCGGNGTVYGMLAAEMLKAQLLGEKHPLSALLTPRRAGAKPNTQII